MRKKEIHCHNCRREAHITKACPRTGPSSRRPAYHIPLVAGRKPVHLTQPQIDAVQQEHEKKPKGVVHMTRLLKEQEHDKLQSHIQNNGGEQSGDTICCKIKETQVGTF